MSGYWYSTQSVGHCGVESDEAAAEQCTWRLPEVKKVVHRCVKLSTSCYGTCSKSCQLSTTCCVVHSDCVNGQIVAAVVKRNSSCFNALPQPNNKTTDGWIECFFNSLLGNHTTGQPSLGGSVLKDDDDVSKLRQTILDLWCA